MSNFIVFRTLDQSQPDWSPHFCIEVNDLDDYRTRLKAGSFQIIEARALPFRPRFFTRDPFNNLIEIVHVEGDYIAAGEGAE